MTDCLRQTLAKIHRTLKVHSECILPLILEEGCSGGMMQLPIGMQMHLAKERQEPPIKLVEISSEDPPCLKEVKKLIPQMCDADPKKRPKAASLTDALVQCLGMPHCIS